MPPDLVGGELDVTIRAGRDLVAKDGGMFTKANSDPFVKVLFGGEEVYKTKTIKKNLNPTWNEKMKHNFSLTKNVLDYDEERLRRWNPTVVFAIFDYDFVGSNDPMGEVVVELGSLMDGQVRCSWSRSRNRSRC